MADEPKPVSEDTIKEAFFLFENEGEETIATNDLSSVVRQLGLNPTSTELKDMVHELDPEGSGTIHFNEFKSMMTRKMRETDPIKELKVAFKVFDKDNNGLISIEELKHLMMNMGEKLTKEELDVLMKEADTDGNGQMNYEEFIAVMTGS